ncbi:POK18 protein, partial [Corythaixoides concolor]|nr:POK18 protein [Corythaixoides concolor]
WPLKGERLEWAQKLVNEQLKLGHIVPLTRPWNTPIFVISKKSGKWRLLQDLRAINAIMSPMGTLQPGVPNPTMIPECWHLMVIDLKDWVFTIFLHPDDCPRFAFSVPVLNNERPMQQYHWIVLPQGMMNSPTICQLVVDDCPGFSWDRVILYHYMDDILLAAETKEALQQAFETTELILHKYDLRTAKEKVQLEAPWKYLGWKLYESQIFHQNFRLVANVNTLNDLQKLLESINWVRPLLGITTEELSPLFNLL